MDTVNTVNLISSIGSGVLKSASLFEWMNVALIKYARTKDGGNQGRSYRALQELCGVLFFSVSFEKDILEHGVQNVQPAQYNSKSIP